jgi:hypothetical protein
MKYFKTFISLILIFLLANKLYAQNIIDSLSIESNTTYSNDFLPFFIQNNRNGIYENKYSSRIISIELERTNQINKIFRFSYGLNAIARYSKNSLFYFNELYGQLKFFGIDLSVGRFIDRQGLSEDFNPETTLGSVMVSNNATPFPKISIKTNRWISVPLTSGFFNWKFSLAHGILNDNRFVKNTYVHQKTFYLNLNLWAFQGYGGLIHNAQWGGVHPTLGKLPQSFNDYLAVATGIIKNKNSSGLEEDVNNVVGNSIAAYDFGLTLKIKPIFFSAYRIFYHEDTVSLRFRNAWDGLWGGSLLFDKSLFGIKKIGYEYLNMIRLGKKRGLSPPEPNGVDNPYNHWIYQSGWTYYGRVIGTPIFLTNNNVDMPLFFPTNSTIVNNVAVAHHAFVIGIINSLNYKVHLIKSYNYGTYKDMEQLGLPYNLRKIETVEYYALFDISYVYKKIKNDLLQFEIGTRIAFDFGELYQPRSGIQFYLKLLPIAFN